MSWEQVLRYASLRKKYISMYAKLLKSDVDRAIIDDNEEIEKLDRELDIDIILQWRYIIFCFFSSSTFWYLIAVRSVYIEGQTYTFYFIGFLMLLRKRHSFAFV